MTTVHTEVLYNCVCITVYILNRMNDGEGNGFLYEEVPITTDNAPGQGQ